jgi:hypothetical protein
MIIEVLLSPLRLFVDIFETPSLEQEAQVAGGSQWAWRPALCQAVGMWVGEGAAFVIEVNANGPRGTAGAGHEASGPGSALGCTHRGPWEPENRDRSSEARSAWRKAKLSRMQSMRLWVDARTLLTPRGCG